MKDRIPKDADHAGRVKLTDIETGASKTYKMTLADEPTDPGTPLNKATFLTDETVKRLWKDIPPLEPTVNDALNRLIDSTYRVGDILTTAHYPGDSWLVCDGEVVQAADWPELADVMSEGMYDPSIPTQEWSALTLTGLSFGSENSTKDVLMQYFKGYWVILKPVWNYPGDASDRFFVVYSDNLNAPIDSWTTIELQKTWDSGVNIVDPTMFAMDGKIVILYLNNIISPNEPGPFVACWMSDDVKNWHLYRYNSESQVTYLTRSFGASPDKKYVWWFSQGTSPLDTASIYKVDIANPSELAIHTEPNINRVTIDIDMLKIGDQNVIYARSFMSSVVAPSSGDLLLTTKNNDLTDWQLANFGAFTDTSFSKIALAHNSTTIVLYKDHMIRYINSLQTGAAWQTYNWATEQPYGSAVLPKWIAVDDEYLYVMCSKIVSTNQIEFTYITGRTITDIINGKGLKSTPYVLNMTDAETRFYGLCKLAFSEKHMVMNFLVTSVGAPTTSQMDMYIIYKQRIADAVYLPNITLDGLTTTYIKGRST
jgi:hypothetical protein